METDACAVQAVCKDSSPSAAWGRWIAWASLAQYGFFSHQSFCDRTCAREYETEQNPDSFCNVPANMYLLFLFFTKMLDGMENGCTKNELYMSEVLFSKVICFVIVYHPD